MSQHLDTAVAGPPTPAPVRDRLSPAEVVVITVLSLSAFVMILSELAMGVALPQVMDDLEVTASVGQWLTTAYALTMAVIIPSSGFLMQRFSLRTLFLATMGLFTLGTVIAAVAPGFELLLIGRIVQAIGTAVLLPMLTTTAIRLAPEGRRGQLMAITTAVPAVAGAISPAISGIVVAQLSWRWIFLLVLPLAVLALVLGGWKIRNLDPTTAVRIDLLSLVLAAIGFGALLYGLSTIGESHGGASLLIAGAALVAGVLGTAAFIARQWRLQHRDAAMLDMRVFAHRDFSLSAAIFLAMVMTAFGLNVVFPLVLQNVLGLGALETGLLLIPGGAAIAITAASVGRVYERVGPRLLVVSGAVMAAAGWALLSTATPGTAIGILLALHLLISIGLAFMWTPLFTLAMGSLPRHLYPHGSAALNTLQQLGGAAGIAVLITVLTWVTNAHSAGSGVSLEGMRAAFIAALILTLASAVGALLLPRRAATVPTDLPIGH
ncbi:DHA2 family efflux MFS transporter permease subunit [Arthrobacter ruber]|uniref:DHA2 family efflux MFS transporter permease subunit n=1 Tax=Arthrobacter ruber TaxID=1258893 RepID=UPI000CF3A36F|nr:DHA2 family efflux MFS transporter permease subunit [Arthrobacter ruber]